MRKLLTTKLRTTLNCFECFNLAKYTKYCKSCKSEANGMRLRLEASVHGACFVAIYTLSKQAGSEEARKAASCAEDFK